MHDTNNLKSRFKKHVMKTALIVGATGLVGKQLVNELLADNNYKQIIAFSRRELPIKHPKLKVELIHFETLNELDWNETIDECYCALGTTQKKSGREGLLKVDYEYVLKLAQFCFKNHVPAFSVVSAQGANYNSRFFYMRTKGQMEEAIKKVGVKTVNIVRPSLITGEREEFRLTEEMAYYVMRTLNPVMTGKAKKYRSVSGLQIAKCMIGLLQEPQEGNLTIESDIIQTY